MVRTLTLVVLRTVSVVLLLVLVAPFAWRAVTGDTFMNVTSDSMRPVYEVGDVLSVRPAEGDELTEVGTLVVVAFGTAGGGNARYVHRVDEVLEDGTAWLRGDNNSDRDPQPVSQDQVEGTPRLALTGAAAEAFTFAQSITGRAIIVAGALIFLFIPVPRRKSQDAGPREKDDATDGVARHALPSDPETPTGP
ncbi:Peptidase S24-like protein [Sanguibacter keddieii DSM 10542]|uniref:Peptidase S24-like protein n=1 Tax=Sanguibacter keddieii (strain ATCC 51767 / DSM 10542 / NCFB 3025 / ST-74) TaxID=446469 RepID=D1BEL6_SANKS|nr:S24/S26 family peptidase [Sanguibacter keddieii]ACZ23302.1 Peptidase S24-like protein [Sanguibacter keddieii DSM 10542]